MKFHRLSLAAILAAGALAAQSSIHPSMASPDRTQWFRGAKFGMFVQIWRGGMIN
ncbi:MAG: hypothetical protein IT167_12505 [Bryobacterales bacterium]|nr:hypothetical protein [Bryobacterales bacterium]